MCLVAAMAPDFDESKDHLVLVAGHFSGVRKLNEIPCMMTSEEIQSGVVDCFSGTPSMSTLTVYEVVYGKANRRELPVAYHPAVMQRVPPGAGEPLVVLLHSDGKHYILTSERAPIARLTSGEWAIPIYEDAQLTVLPCGAKPLVHKLEFAAPLPSESLSDWTEDSIEAIKQNAHGYVRNGRFYITHGIPLKDMRSFLASVAPTTESYYCNEYE
jgi:hypothetical protein